MGKERAEGQPDSKRVGWRALGYTLALSAFVASAFSWLYLRTEEALTLAFGLAAAPAHYFLVLSILVGILGGVAVLGLHARGRALPAALSALLSVAGIAFVTDLVVYQQYRSHVTLAFVDLFLNAGDTIAFSWWTWMEILGLAAAVAAGCGALVWASFRIARKRRFPLWLLGVFFVWYAVQGAVHALAFAQFTPEILAVKKCLPLYPNIRAQKFFAKMGIKADEGVVQAKASGALRYPMNPLEFSAPSGKRRNIVFLLADSLRADMLNPDVMPKTFAWSQSAVRYLNHYSASNGTRGGIFGLFYGLPPNYWHTALMTRTPSALITSLQDAGYDIQAFATATIDSPEFDDTVFATVRPLRIGSTGKDGVERDSNSVRDFLAYLGNRKARGDARPFLAFVFLDTTHGYSHPKGMVKFSPEWDSPHYLELTPGTDPTPLRNLYKNSAVWTDVLFSRVLDGLRDAGLDEETIVMVTSDHGQEINDSGKNFWGHNSAFNDAQTKVPLVVRWPGVAAGVEDKLVTCAYDLPMTLLKSELGMRNPNEDAGIGLDLFQDRESIAARKWVMMASYNEMGIREVSGRIFHVDRIGLIHVYDNLYDKHPDQSRGASVREAFSLLNKYAR